MGLVAKLLILLPLLSVLGTTVGQSFECNTKTECWALVGYVPVNTTTISAVQSLFSVKNFRSLLGANNLPLSTPRNFTVTKGRAFKVPIPCICQNNTGISNKVPVYKVKKDDTLYFIANQIYSAFLKYPRIVEVNGIKNANVIEVGQELWIPIPCSCDDVNGEKVVHYTHVVQEGSTVEQIAQTFGTDSETLFKLNGIANDSELFADTPFDVPLRACSSSIKSDSLDFPLLVSNRTYAVTANDCVQCKCDSGNNWTLQCQPSELNSSNSARCPSMQCEGSEALYLGNTTLSTCNRTTCAYNGYINNQTILTSPDTESTCPVSGGSSPSSEASRIGSSRSMLFVLVHLVLVCYLFQ